MTSDSRLEKLLEGGEFVVTSECGPPRGADPEIIRKKGELIKGAVDAINVTDNQTSVVRMSSFSSCVILRQMGINRSCSLRDQPHHLPFRRPSEIWGSRHRQECI